MCGKVFAEDICMQYKDIMCWFLEGILGTSINLLSREKKAEMFH
jgi:hypothetical protein